MQTETVTVDNEEGDVGGMRSSPIGDRSSRSPSVADATRVLPGLEMSPVTQVAAVILAVLLFATLAFFRDEATGGPHHDEVIALMAAKGLEREWARLSTTGEPPLHVVAPASRWHEFTHRFTPLPFSENQADVMSWDKHPPLAFWVMNRWLALFPDAGYRHALVLVWLELLLTAAILGITVFRCSGRSSLAVVAFALFLAGNSAIFTATWVRQYALFMVCFATLVLASAELTRAGLSRWQFSCWLTLYGLATLAGMMCQYTFATMTGPIHLTVLGVFVVRRQWSSLAMVLLNFAISASLFFLLLPGVVRHASAVSAGMERRWQLLGALSGIPRMYIPFPSSTPVGFLVIAGSAALLGPLIMAGLVLLRRRHNPSENFADVRVPLVGMLGAGVSQFALVAMGYFPGWATGENHMCAFWLLTVFAMAILMANWTQKTRTIIVLATLTMMLGMQSLFIWHSHRIVPRLNTSYIASLRPDLVCVDNLARGFVLQVTDLIPSNSKVLATDSPRLAEQMTEGDLPDRVLYLPMDTTVRDGKELVISSARRAGYHVEELPVVHAGMYEAVLFLRQHP